MQKHPLDIEALVNETGRVDLNGHDGRRLGYYEDQDKALHYSLTCQAARYVNAGPSLVAALQSFIRMENSDNVSADTFKAVMKKAENALSLAKGEWSCPRP